MVGTAGGDVAADAGPARRGRGRPPLSQATIEQRRQQIVEAAYEVFTERGYHATGIADIAARLDIGHGTFYRYFDNKRDILDQVVDFAVARFFTAVVTDTAGPPRTKGEFRQQMTDLGSRLYAGVAEGDPRLARLILLDAGSIDAAMSRRILGMLDSIATTIAPMLGLGVRHGFLRRDLDVDTAAKALTGCMLVALFDTLRGPTSPDARARYVETVVSMICDNRPSQ